MNLWKFYKKLEIDSLRLKWSRKHLHLLIVIERLLHSVLSVLVTATSTRWFSGDWYKPNVCCDQSILVVAISTVKVLIWNQSTGSVTSNRLTENPATLDFWQAINSVNTFCFIFKVLYRLLPSEICSKEVGINQSVSKLWPFNVILSKFWNFEAKLNARCSVGEDRKSTKNLLLWLVTFEDSSGF